MLVENKKFVKSIFILYSKIKLVYLTCWFFDFTFFKNNSSNCLNIFHKPTAGSHIHNSLKHPFAHKRAVEPI